MLRLIPIFLSAVFLASCGSVSTVSVGPYTPQNATKLNCSIDIKEFTYKPYEDYKAQSGSVENFAKYGGLSSPNRVLSSSAEEVYLTVPVAGYVQIGTALELERSGVRVGNNDSEYTLNATVNEFKADAISRTVTWYYSITYTLTSKKTGKVMLTTSFDELKYKTGKNNRHDAPYSDVADYLIYSGYMKLVNDIKSSHLCVGHQPVQVKPKSKKR